MAHPLLDVMTSAAHGVFPRVDGYVSFLPDLPHGNRAIVALTGHAYIAAGLTADHFNDVTLDGFGEALAPATVLRVADGGVIGVNDVILVAPGTGTRIQTPSTSMWDDHARVRHARHLRTAVVVYGDERGFVTVGQGLAGRPEMSIGIAETNTSSGLGRHLIGDACGAVPIGQHLFAAVAPGNARSLRAFLAAGFSPIGSEIIIDRSAVQAPTPQTQ
ncbi:hypothetical protein [Ilumatobacter sp.]|uniref:hypothetical protein n=2 Tax=Ilumatobacter sp. TaxID=1967498 RepID=UPI0037512403